MRDPVEYSDVYQTIEHRIINKRKALTSDVDLVNEVFEKLVAL